MQQAQSSGSAPADPLAWELDGRRYERLPEAVRRQQRFGGATAAALAEAIALRREIDRAGLQLGRRIADARPGIGKGGGGNGGGGNGGDGGDDRTMVPCASAEAPAELEDGDNWISLRDAGLAVLASIEQMRGGARRNRGSVIAGHKPATGRGA